MTAQEFALEINRHPVTAAGKLKQWEAEGKVESVWGRIGRQNQRFYRPISK